MRRGCVLLVAAISLSACVGRPAFIPTTRHLYADFTPLPQPKAEVPVGALWVTGYGSVGAGAAPDNLETERSLSNVVYDSDFQASLTLGLLKFLNLDPSMRNKVSARFSDITIVRLKNWSKLEGPAEQPRLYEALRAGTITVTAASNAGLDIENRALSQGLPVFGRGTTGTARTYTVDGKDLVFAIHVAQMRTVESDLIRIKLKPGQTARRSIGGADITMLPVFAAGCLKQVTATLLAPSHSGLSDQSIVIERVNRPAPFRLAVPSVNVGGALMSDVILSIENGDNKTCQKNVSLRLKGKQLKAVRR